MQKLLRKTELVVTLDQDFPAVIRACAEPRDYSDSTWITTEMQQAYCELHRVGVAHSVEVWRDDQLVGGLYGVALGSVFFGESMFSRRSNSSKVGFIFLVRQLEHWGYTLIDCQMPTEHLLSLGAESISRDEFMRKLTQLCPSNAKNRWAGNAL